MIETEKMIGRQLLFVGGDLSGIQSFLYNITSKKAAVSLKGRSKYLEDKIVEIEKEILETVYCGQATNVYSSGGKFYLIGEDTEEHRLAIDAIFRRVEEEIWKDHKGQLSVNIAYVPFSINADGTINVAEEKGTKLGRLWKEVNAEFARLKTQKFKNVLFNHFDEMFEPIAVDDHTRVCAVTGIESADCVKLEKDNWGDEIWVLPSVKKQVELGQKLSREHGFKTFEEYADKSFLGVLRMDVDGLGKVFIEGFPTFKEYTQFSDLLSNFFSEKLPLLCQSEKYKEFVNIIYAGGDDMFIVGRWDKVIDFAYDSRNAFINHVNKNGVSISGGVVVVDPKFPISKAAEMSGDAEHAAKTFRNGEKNAFNMFGQSLSWDKEFDYVQQFKDELVDLCQAENMPKSLLHKLMAFAGLKSRGEYKYIWNTAYYLARFRKGKSERIQQFCNRLKAELLESPNGSRNYELVALAARWAEMIMKEV